ncbi:hypothetical protein [Streptomyces sp. NBC_00878]|uniref:hypothetical protein n=1 Tax=Streptomyces sp. NBC_00878 TaxID=2975854 RepID=UPI002250EA89|nr:hypothetical protein [Streptomyces sp. NBC_00878]MCX4908073.1 hypothetical protein [Streptomyces sp. NBC_00878]
MSRAPQSSRSEPSLRPDEPEGFDEAEEDEDEWGGCGWLSGIALLGLGGGCE